MTTFLETLDGALIPISSITYIGPETAHKAGGTCHQVKTADGRHHKSGSKTIREHLVSIIPAQAGWECVTLYGGEGWAAPPELVEDASPIIGWAQTLAGRVIPLTAEYPSGIVATDTKQYAIRSAGDQTVYVQGQDYEEVYGTAEEWLKYRERDYEEERAKAADTVANAPPMPVVAESKR